MKFLETLQKDFDDMLKLRASLGYATSTDNYMLPEFLYQIQELKSLSGLPLMS